MNAAEQRDKMIQYIYNLDESKLQVVYNRLLEDETIVGYEADGAEISLGQLKQNIATSRKEIENGEFYDIDDLIKESKNW